MVPHRGSGGVRGRHRVARGESARLAADPRQLRGAALAGDASDGAGGLSPGGETDPRAGLDIDPRRGAAAGGGGGVRQAGCARLRAELVVYLQAVKPIRGLDWILIPVAVLLLVGAAVFGKKDPHDYRPIVTDVWIWVHRVTAYGGAVAFAVAAGVGVIYVVTSRRLR